MLKPSSRLSEAYLDTDILKLDWNVVELTHYMAVPMSEMTDYLPLVDTNRVHFDTEGRYIFIDNGADVLAVAHADSVRSYIGGDLKLTHDMLHCATLDNRLGLWLICYAIPMALREMGYSTDTPWDILITTDEEIARSTAANFVPPRQYNWMFQFDRGSFGEVAMYQYLDDDMVSLVAEYGLTPVRGSYTDIAALRAGCKGLNFSCGMNNYHNPGAYALREDVERMAYKFVQFFDDNRHEYLKHEDKEEDVDWFGDGDMSPIPWSVATHADYEGWDDAYDRDNVKFKTCQLCGNYEPMYEMGCTSTGAYICWTCYDEIAESFYRGEQG